MSQIPNKSRRYNLVNPPSINSSIKEIISKRDGTLKKNKPIFFKFFNDPNNSRLFGGNEKGTPKKQSNSSRRLDVPGTIEIKKIQSNFEENLEKVKNLKFTTEKKKRNEQGNAKTITKVSSLGFPSFRRHKTESQEVFREYPKQPENLQNDQNSRNSFSFKGSPRRNDQANCVNHEDKKAKYLLTTNSVPFFVCSKCAVRYANNGFALESMEDFIAKRSKTENANITEYSILPGIFESLKPGFSQVKTAIHEKKDEAMQFYSKQMSKVEGLFSSTIRLIKNHFDIAKKTVEIYKNRTLEKLELLSSDLESNMSVLSKLETQSIASLEGLKNGQFMETVDRLKATLDSYYSEELILYKFCTDTSKMENIFNHMFPYHFIFPKYRPLINQNSVFESSHRENDKNKRVGSFISNAGTKPFEMMTQEESDSKKKNIVSVLEKINENQEKNNQYYMKILRGSSIPSPKNKTFAFPYQEHTQNDITYKNRSMQLFPENFLKPSFHPTQNSKAPVGKDERGYIIFEENSDGVDLRCYEKRSSLSSPNFHT